MDLTVINTQSFAQTFALSDWSVLYDLTAGVLRCQVRKTPADPVLLYEWATANDTRETAKGAIDLVAVKAVGLLTFTGNPAAGDVVSLGSAVVTFVAGPAGSGQVAVAATAEATLSAFLDYLNASSDPDIAACTYSLTATTVLVEHKVAGAIGNAFELGATGSAVTASGPTLEAGGMSATMFSPIGDLAAFTGTYAYDLRFEAAPIFAVLDGGSITFQQGVTR